MNWLTPSLYEKYREPINRLEFVNGLVDYYEFVTEADVVYENIEPYGDNNSEIVLKATALGITTGKGNNDEGQLLFKPEDTLTRQEMATFLIRMMGLLEEESLEDNQGYEFFSDDQVISDWAKPSVYKSRTMGYLDGVGDNRFEPIKTVSKEEALVMLAKVMKQKTVNNMKYVLLFSMEMPVNYRVIHDNTMVQGDYGKYGEPLLRLNKGQIISVFRRYKDSDGRVWGMTSNYSWLKMDDLEEIIEDVPDKEELDTSEDLYGMYKVFSGLVPERDSLSLELRPMNFVEPVSLEGKGYVFYDEKGQAWSTVDNRFYYIGMESNEKSLEVDGDYTALSLAGKVDYLLSKLGFDTPVNSLYDLDTASDLIVFQAFIEAYYGRTIDGEISETTIDILEAALMYGLDYDTINKLYISKWEPPSPSIEKDPTLNGRLGDHQINLVKLPVRYDLVGYGERSTAIAWAVLVHEGKYASLGAEDNYFYLTYPESGYRTYDQQVTLFNKYGSSRAAYPGTSNHGWGLALDLNITAYVRGLIAYDPEKLKAFEALMLDYGFHPLKYSDGSYWEEWHWDYEG